MAKPSWLKNLIHPFDDEEEDYGGLTSPTPEPPSTPRPTVSATPKTPPSHSAFEDAGKRNKVATIHTTAQLQVYLANPDKFENAAEIAEHLRERRTVVLNLEQTNKDQARRLLDFLGGVAYAQDGKVKRVAINTYLITPYNVDLINDLAEELENNGLYF